MTQAPFPRDFFKDNRPQSLYGVPEAAVFKMVRYELVSCLIGLTTAAVTDKLLTKDIEVPGRKSCGDLQQCQEVISNTYMQPGKPEQAIVNGCAVSTDEAKFYTRLLLWVVLDV